MIKVALVCSHGGHLTEMLELMAAFEDQEIVFVTYFSRRVAELEQLYHVYALPNIGASLCRLLCSLPCAWRILRRERPDVLVSTGSEIAIPFFLCAKALRIRTVFVESLCRVRTCSKTGRVLYPLADVFLYNGLSFKNPTVPRRAMKGDCCDPGHRGYARGWVPSSGASDGSHLRSN